MSEDFGSDGTYHRVQKDICLVPWYNAAQFKKVYEYLYSSELVKKRWAVDQISVWETRCHPSLPTAIEASLVIVRAIIQDILLTNGASLCQERDIQMMYSMALVRFVNLTIETHQKSQPNVVTTAQIAKGLGIPSWIVDLRNEATHSYLPSLASLRMAAEIAMKYLNESYWEKEIPAMKNFEKEPFNGKEIKELIHRYITLKFHILNDKGNNMTQAEQYRRNVAESRIVRQKLAFCAQKHRRQFMNILVSDGFFIPYDEELKNLMTPNECLQYEEVYDENYTGPRSIPPVPVELLKLWKGLLSMLNTIQAIPLLLEALLKSQADRSEMGKKLVISWAMKILRIHSVEDCFEENSLRKIFRKKGLILNWHSLFNAAVSRPCLYTPYIFPLIFSHLDLKEGVTRYILNLMAIALGQADWKSVKLPVNYPIYTVEDLKKMKKLQNAKKENRNSAEECIWSVAEDSCYKSWQIGIVINPLDDTEKTEEQLEDFIPIEYFDEKMDYTEKYFLSNENDNEEEYFVNNQPNSSEDEMELSEGQTFLYKKK